VRARHPGRRLFGYFFFAAEEKVTRAPDARGNANGRDCGQQQARSTAPPHPTLSPNDNAVGGEGSESRAPDARGMEKGRAACTIKSEVTGFLTEAGMTSQKQKRDYAGLLPRALRAIRCANVRFPQIAAASFDLPSQSGLRWNDE
jgi:hypothetical protein